MIFLGLGRIWNASIVVALDAFCSFVSCFSFLPGILTPCYTSSFFKPVIREYFFQKYSIESGLNKSYNYMYLVSY